jgi:transcriptional regulator with XRE-family HTH domain
MAVRKPSMQLKAFGAEVRRLREEAGVKPTDLAKLVSVSRSYISQVELGRTRCRKDFPQRLDQALGTGTQLEDAWADLLQSTSYPKYFADYPRAEESAAFLQAFEIMRVFGLFQTEPYMRALLTKESSVETRLHRQDLLKRENPPLVSVVLAEALLWSPVGGAEVMREQCEYLVDVSGWPNVTLQIAPTSVHYQGITGSFNLATQPNGDELLYMQTATGGVTTDDSEDILQIVSAFSAMQARALSVDDSREFLRKAVVQWT